jgi:hypothetical protein
MFQYVCMTRACYVENDENAKHLDEIVRAIIQSALILLKVDQLNSTHTGRKKAISRLERMVLEHLIDGSTWMLHSSACMHPNMKSALAHETKVTSSMPRFSLSTCRIKAQKCIHLCILAHTSTPKFMV